ncbi:MAG TPA: hypothetical protein VLD67_11305 [Vicinamibacterales bacterium]|nr:hypothetical protein [Vicinamibacterales bacterium]
MLVIRVASASSGQPRPAQITDISVARAGTVTIVRIEADGPLPAPEAGEVDGPPRLFFDFPGVRTRTRAVAAPSGALVRRVRAALNTSEPPLTRVVLDLSGQTPFRLDLAALEQGRLSVFLGAAETPPVEPGTPKEALAKTPDPIVQPSGVSAPAPGSGRGAEQTSQRPASTVPSRSETSPPQATAIIGTPASTPAIATRRTSGTAPPSSADADEYRKQLGTYLTRARALRPVLSAIDSQAYQTADALDRAVSEFTEVQRQLAAAKVPEALRTAHDMLIRACTLGAMAAGLQHEAARAGDDTALRNAASAAAGSLLLMDRACIEIGCEPA